MVEVINLFLGRDDDDDDEADENASTKDDDDCKSNAYSNDDNIMDDAWMCRVVVLISLRGRCTRFGVDGSLRFIFVSSKFQE